MHDNDIDRTRTTITQQRPLLIYRKNARIVRAIMHDSESTCKLERTMLGTRVVALPVVDQEQDIAFRSSTSRNFGSMLVKNHCTIADLLHFADHLTHLLYLMRFPRVSLYVYAILLYRQ